MQFLYYIVENMDKKIKSVLRKLAITRPDEAPSAVWFGKLMGVIAKAYILTGEIGLFRKYIILTNAIAQAYIYKGS